jgi:hypothetical protein
MLAKSCGVFGEGETNHLIELTLNPRLKQNEGMMQRITPSLKNVLSIEENPSQAIADSLKTLTRSLHNSAPSTESKPRFWLGQGLHGLSTLLRMPQLNNIFPQDKKYFLGNARPDLPFVAKGWQPGVE